MKKLYSNVGKKIQALAKFGGVIGVVCIIIGIITLFSGSGQPGEMAGIVMIVGGVVLVLSSLPMYAFGQITDDVHEIRNCTNGTANKIVNDLPEL